MSLIVYDRSGQKIEADKGSLVKNLCAIARALKGRGLCVVTAKFTKADIDEYLGVYKNGRRVTGVGSDRHKNTFNSGEWLPGWPNLAIDWNGDPSNGGHTSKGFKDSDLKEQEFDVLLGVHPKMGPRIDTGKKRTTAQQLAYFGIKMAKKMDDSDKQNFATSVSYIFALLTGNDLVENNLTFRQARQDPFLHEQGIAVAELLQPFFTQIFTLLQDEIDNAMDSNDSTRCSVLMNFKRAQFYIPALMLWSTGDETLQGWIKKLILGKNVSNDALLSECRDTIIGLGTNCKGRRDEEDVIHGALRVISYLYAKKTGKDRYEPPARYALRKVDIHGNVVERGCDRESVTKEVKIWDTHSDIKKSEYIRFKKEVTTEFLQGLEIKS